MRLYALSFSLLLSVNACGDDDPACVPGVSQACVGVGGCAGGQVCLADGSGFGPCECDAADGGQDGGEDGGQDAGQDAMSDDATIDDASPDSAGDAPADTATDVPPDATDPDECDPLLGTGCAPSEKCTWVRMSLGSAEGRTTCAPDGDVAEGDACEFVEDGDEVYDDCQGSYCFGGECSAVCLDSADTCAEGTHCVLLAGVFTDRDPDLGTCVFSCDPLMQNCDGDQGCYLTLTTGEPTCAFPAAGAGTQGDTCPFINSCERGYGCIFEDGVGGARECAFHCDAGGGGGPTCADGPGAAFECIPLRTFYSGLPDSIPASSGLCVDCTRFPSGTRGCP